MCLMMTDMERRLGLLCALLALLVRVATTAPTDTIYVRLGGELKLVPEMLPGTVITGLLWKYGPDKVAEWGTFNLLPVLEYFREFKGHAELNVVTGVLHVKDLTTEHIGVYSVELNRIWQRKTYNVTSIDPVPKPTVSMSPLACGPDTPSCLLSCAGGVGNAGPVKSFWRTDEGQWEEFGKDSPPNITNSGAMWAVKTVSCRLTNPVSEEQSDPIRNPFHRSAEGGGLGWIAAVVVVVLILFCCGAFAVYKRAAGSAGDSGPAGRPEEGGASQRNGAPGIEDQEPVAVSIEDVYQATVTKEPLSVKERLALYLPYMPAVRRREGQQLVRRDEIVPMKKAGGE